MLEQTTRSLTVPLFGIGEPGQTGRNEEIDLLDDILDTGSLSAVFQPIIDFRSQSYIAFEGLIRGPKGSVLHSPQRLFEAAERHGQRRNLERACRETVFRAFASLKLPGKLFINSSLDCLDDAFFRNGGTLDLLYQIGLSPNRVVIELTENQRIKDFPDIHHALAQYRKQGYQIAIDDLGEGFANLRMWSEVKPDYVKIDRHFIDGIAEDSLKHHFVKAMQTLAESCSARIIAEGIENEADCLMVRDMGIALGQGFLIAMPTGEPATLPDEKIISIIKQRGIVVFPSNPISTGTITVSRLTRPVEPVSPHAFNDEICRRFESNPELMSMPVVDCGTPLGLINRHELIDRMARPFRRELFGRRPCIQFMDPMPLCIDQDATVQEAALLISRSARHHIYDGFIVTRQGEYQGIGSAHDLMGMITEMQMQAARYANPLTQLPGNVPINEHIERLLERRTGFHACYFDIDHFKPFNDVFGYRKGDDVIVLLAQTLSAIIDPLVDFCGHIGGDDFMVLFQSEDWEVRCQEALRRFDQRMSCLVEEKELVRSGDERGFLAENRRGQMVFYALPTLSIGAVPVGTDFFESHREISAAAAEAKKNAKRTAGSSLFIERRTIKT